MPNKPKGLAAVEAAYYRKLYGDTEPGTEKLSLVYPGKDISAKIKITDVKPVPIRQTNQRMVSGLEKESPEEE